jgi:hypothetical protein
MCLYLCAYACVWVTIPCRRAYQAKASRAYNDEEDVFLVVLMHKYGYGNWDRIRMEIRRVGGCGKV